MTENENSTEELLNLLKMYYRLCRTEKTLILKNEEMLQMIGTLITDQRPTIGSYVCKILTLLTEDDESAKLLSKNEFLKKQISLIISCEIHSNPRLFRRYLIIHSKISNNETSKKSNITAPSKFSLFGTSKQYVFEFDEPNDEQRRNIEKKILEIKGVVSICFQSMQNESVKCLIRFKDVEPKIIANTILGCGLEVVKQIRKTEDGSLEEFEFYADAMEMEETRKDDELPKYLDDNIEIFDPTQCIATKEQIQHEEKSSGWLTTVKSFFW